MSLSILIINWNSKDCLRACLRSVEATCQDLAPQVIVVEGGSFDGCAEMIAAEFPGIDFIQSDLNLGFGGSNNLGVISVRREMLLLLNPDTELRESSVSRLLEDFASLPDAGLLAPRLHNSDGSLQDSCVQSFPTLLNQLLDSDLLRRIFPNSSLWGVGKAYSSLEPTEVEAVSGACMLMRTADYKALGGFSPEFYFYGEDMDLCARLRQTGKKTWHIPEPGIVHHGGVSTSSQLSKFATVHLRHAIQIYLRKHHGPLHAAAYRVLMPAMAVLRLTFLLPARLIARPGKTRRLDIAIDKWTTVLRWGLGMESWVSRPVPEEAPAGKPRTAS